MTRAGALEAAARACAREMGFGGTANAKQMIASCAAMDEIGVVLSRISRRHRWVGEVATIRAEGRLTPKRDRARCHARTRRGGTCQARAVWDRLANAPRNGRCRLHGGLTTRDDEKHERRQRRPRSAANVAAEASPQALAAFDLYRSLPDPRSLRAVARAMAVRLPTVERWAFEGAWAERVRPTSTGAGQWTRRERIGNAKGSVRP